jgi:hypothetical protein
MFAKNKLKNIKIDLVNFQRIKENPAKTILKCFLPKKSQFEKAD